MDNFCYVYKEVTFANQKKNLLTSDLALRERGIILSN